MLIFLIKFVIICLNYFENDVKLKFFDCFFNFLVLNKFIKPSHSFSQFRIHLIFQKISSSLINNYLPSSKVFRNYRPFVSNLVMQSLEKFLILKREIFLNNLLI